MDLDSKTEPEPRPITHASQIVTAWVARFLSLVIFILIFVWFYVYLDGLAWKGRTWFNLHPFFMMLGVAVFLTNGVLAWRDCPLSHNWTKAVHVTFNVLALLFIALGLYVTIDANRPPHIVSLHSWMALASVGLLTLQALGGITFFLAPIFPFHIRARALPAHAWLGVISYLFLMLVVCTGIIEWLAFKNESRAAYTSGMSRLGNSLGFLIFMTALIAAWSLIPRRDVEADIEERDGAAFDDAARARLKGERGAGAGVETYGGERAYPSTRPSSPFGTEVVPPRRAGQPYVERELRF